MKARNRSIVKTNRSESRSSPIREESRRRNLSVLAVEFDPDSTPTKEFHSLNETAVSVNMSILTTANWNKWSVTSLFITSCTNECAKILSRINKIELEKTQVFFPSIITIRSTGCAHLSLFQSFNPVSNLNQSNRTKRRNFALSSSQMSRSSSAAVNNFALLVSS